MSSLPSLSHILYFSDAIKGLRMKTDISMKELRYLDTRSKTYFLSSLPGLYGYSTSYGMLVYSPILIRFVEWFTFLYYSFNLWVSVCLDVFNFLFSKMQNALLGLNTSYIHLPLRQWPKEENTLTIIHFIAVFPEVRWHITY